MSKVIDAKEAIKQILRDRDFVRGVGISQTPSGTPCVLVYIYPELDEEQRSTIPHQVDGVPVTTAIIREIRDLSSSLRS